ncbi:MAG TPA: hypothetical protein VHJ20_10215 [Polyangia bacterium]|nr:hypothetical protein [Polyangia bacterium]
MPVFDRIIGIDYSGAKTPTESLEPLRVFASDNLAVPVEIAPPPSPRRYWTRRGVAEWLVDQLTDGPRTLVGIDHGFSFPLRYFEAHRLEPDWPTFLDDFQRHWPTDGAHVYVDFVRDGHVGNGAERGGNARWRRITEERASAKSVFHFDVPGQVAKSTHAGIPWLRFMRQKLAGKVDFWPFDGWKLSGRSVVAEVYPSLWSRGFASKDRTPDQHDAYSIAEWLRRADLSGEVAALFDPALSPHERAAADVEGWILGVG